MSKLVLRVAAKAVIVNKAGQVLVVREARTYGDGTNIGIYGIPGGRLNEGESFDDGLAREAREETGLEVSGEYPIYIGEWRPIIKDVPHQIIAIFTVCKAKTTDVILSEEHDDFKWVDAVSMKKLKFMDPDDKVLMRFFKI